MLRFTVKDTGIGIPEASIQLLAEPYTQLESSNNEFGAGLGLCISKEIIAKIGMEFLIVSK